MPLRGIPEQSISRDFPFLFRESAVPSPETSHTSRPGGLPGPSGTASLGGSYQPRRSLRRLRSVGEFSTGAKTERYHLVQRREYAKTKKSEKKSEGRYIVSLIFHLRKLPGRENVTDIPLLSLCKFVKYFTELDFQLIALRIALPSWNIGNYISRRPTGPCESRARCGR